jgi:hypothetical protein
MTGTENRPRRGKGSINGVAVYLEMPGAVLPEIARYLEVIMQVA